MKTIHKLLALALCLTLLCGAVSATMRETGTSGLKLADEVTYTHTSWPNDQKEGQSFSFSLTSSNSSVVGL